MIRIDRVWLAVDPMDMRAGLDTTLARVVRVFGAAHPHHAYVFANRRATRVKVLVHDGIGVWLAVRRLNQGKFVWPAPGAPSVTLQVRSIDLKLLTLEGADSEMKCRPIAPSSKSRLPAR